jgi:hypothetical protein
MKLTDLSTSKNPENIINLQIQLAIMCWAQLKVLLQSIERQDIGKSFMHSTRYLLGGDKDREFDRFCPAKGKEPAISLNSFFTNF